MHSGIVDLEAFLNRARYLFWSRSIVKSVARSWRDSSRDDDEQRHSEYD
jgi:hypothetical protein